MEDPVLVHNAFENKYIFPLHQYDLHYINTNRFIYNFININVYVCT